MNANLSVIGNIGDKLKLPISYNTLANFDFDNQLKLDYTGSDDEIIKKIEAGNISFSSKGTLIPGAQKIFGIKTQLQFGKLFITGVLANQRLATAVARFAGRFGQHLFRVQGQRLRREPALPVSPVFP